MAVDILAVVLKLNLTIITTHAALFERREFIRRAISRDGRPIAKLSLKRVASGHCARFDAQVRNRGRYQ